MWKTSFLLIVETFFLRATWELTENTKSNCIIRSARARGTVLLPLCLKQPSQTPTQRKPALVGKT
jgi:hypothetical protein